jgi:hypothetical protein
MGRAITVIARLMLRIRDDTTEIPNITPRPCSRRGVGAAAPCSVETGRLFCAHPKLETWRRSLGIKRWSCCARPKERSPALGPGPLVFRPSVRPSVRHPKVAFLVEFGQIWMKFDEIRFPFVDFPLLFQKQALFAIFDRFSPFLFRKRALFIKSRHISPKSPQNYPKLPKSRLIRHQSTRKSLNSPPNYP